MNFIHDDFMLQNEVAKKLYHEVSKNQKIIDYHCHLDPKMIAENKEFNDITEIWLLGDHYKWRNESKWNIDENMLPEIAQTKKNLKLGLKL